MNKKTCYLDGNALCIVGKDFINIQESRCMFVDLNEKQLKEFNDLDKKISKNLQNLMEEKKKRGEKLI